MENDDTSKKEVDVEPQRHTHDGMIRIGVDCEVCQRMLEEKWNLKILDPEFN